jgi:hypothetical protein
MDLNNEDNFSVEKALIIIKVNLDDGMIKDLRLMIRNYNKEQSAKKGAGKMKKKTLTKSIPSLIVDFN